MSGPQAVAKMIRNGGTRCPADTKRQFGYLSQDGTVLLELPDGYGGPELVVSPDKFLATAEEWALSTGKWQRGQIVDGSSPTLTTHLVTSFPPGTNQELAKRVARNFASRLFDRPRRRTDFPEGAREHKFPYITALHTDKGHPHIHIVVCRSSTEGGWLKIANRQGERSNPNVLDTFTFSDLRYELVEAAFEEGLDLEATTRLGRGLMPRNFSDVAYRRESPAIREQWLRRAAGGDDNFVRVTEGGSESGSGTGNRVEPDRGHTPEPEWSATGTDREPVEVERARAVTHDWMPARAEPNVNPSLEDGASDVPGQMDLDDDAGRPGERLPQNMHTTSDSSGASGSAAGEGAEDAGTGLRRRWSEALGSDATNGDPPASGAQREDTRPSKRARRDKELPNVLTRRGEALEESANKARERWEAAEEKVSSGAVTRAQKRAVQEAEEAKEAWITAERDAQNDRMNPGSKRRADEAAVNSKRPRLASAAEGSSAGENEAGSGRSDEREPARSARSGRHHPRRGGRED